MSSYLILRRMTAEDLTGEPSVGLDGVWSGELPWLDIGTVEAPSDARSAVKVAMAKHGIEEGDFLAIPERSQLVHSPRVKKQTIWNDPVTSSREG